MKLKHVIQLTRFLIANLNTIYLHNGCLLLIILINTYKLQIGRRPIIIELQYSVYKRTLYTPACVVSVLQMHNVPETALYYAPSVFIVELPEFYNS